MDHRRTPHPTSSRTRVRLVPAALGLAAALLLGACGASGSDGSGTVDISDLDDPTETTLRPDADTTETTEVAGDEVESVDASGESGSDLCVAVSRVLLAPVLLDENVEEITDDQGLDAIAVIADEVPEDLQEGWSEYLDLVEASLSGADEEPDDEAVDRVTQTVADSFSWAQERCPDLPPAWACPTQSSFEQVGEPVDPPEPADSPEGALYDPEGAVELDRSDDTVLFGWLDEDGLVTDVTEVSREDGGWLSTDSSACR